MNKSTIRTWFLIHKWSSIVCTAFLLMLCLTGLPLIFHHEIDALSDKNAHVEQATGGPLKSLDEMMAIGLAEQPGNVGLFVSFDEDQPVVNITTGQRPDVPGSQMTVRSYDRRTGAFVGMLETHGVMGFLLTLHTEMFLGLPGMLFLGLMGLLFFAAIVSGVVLYAPFMRKLAFGTIRASRSARLKWLDAHNLIGIVTLAWASVVGLTGVINTLGTPIIQLWQRDDVAELTSTYRDLKPVPPNKLASLQAAVETAMAALPGSRIQFVAFPGGAFSSKHHYAVFLQGTTPLTKRLLTPALIDATTGELTAVRPLPWYAQALLLSQPLHFGDYGGMPLKILWALLDIVTIVVLGSGLYLWLEKRRAPLAARLTELQEGGTAAVAADDSGTL